MLGQSGKKYASCGLGPWNPETSNVFTFSSDLNMEHIAADGVWYC